MDKPTALVTGANGEMGHLLIPALADRGHRVVALDLAPLAPGLAARCTEVVQGSITDAALLAGAFERFRPESIWHLAAILSTKAETDPDLAHEVNVGGTLGLMRLSRRAAAASGRSVRFLFPSSIAVYGLPDADTKTRAGAVREHEWTSPSAIYGCTKLYCELVGSHAARAAVREVRPGLDFRALRFPGLISAETVPSGGTSDYGPEMIHAAARGKPYACFVSEGTRLPFMTMPDAVEAFLRLADAPAGALTTRVYNIRAFSPTAAEIRDEVVRLFPGAAITFRPVERRQAIVDSWPGDLDDGAARRDWGHAPRHGLREAFGEYLLPSLMKRYPVGCRS